MQIVIAPNAFKGNLSAEEAAKCIADGIGKSNLDCKCKLIPIGDGGDGTASLIAHKFKGSSITTRVHDPLGRIINSSFGWIENTKTAIIEMSDASGLKLLKTKEFNPLKANSRGTGELMKAALDKGAKKIILAIGGSATVDGATGLLSAMGIRFLNESGKEITNFPGGLIKLKSLDTNSINSALALCEVVVLCDVRNNLLGEKGAAAVFGPQKGASEEDVILLENCMQKLNQVTKKYQKINMDSIEYGGAAGGVAAGLAAFVNAKLVSGIEYFLDLVHFDDALEMADIVITAEGSLDEQTLEGKGPFGVAARAKKKNIPVVALAGQVPLKITKRMQDYFEVIFSISNGSSPIEEAMKNTSQNLTRTAYALGNLLALYHK